MATGPLVPRVLRIVHEPALLVAAGAVRQPLVWPSGAGRKGELAVVFNQENELGAGVLGPTLEEDGTAGASRKVPGTQEPGLAILPTSMNFGGSAFGFK